MIETTPTKYLNDEELLQMLAQGSSDKQIARWLNVSLSAVKQRLLSLYGTLVEQTKHVIPPIASPEPKARGYGMPCSTCHTYYSADSPRCPLCNSTVRIAPTPARPLRPRSADVTTGTVRC
jgi:hypothetical protein